MTIQNPKSKIILRPPHLAFGPLLPQSSLGEKARLALFIGEDFGEPAELPGRIAQDIDLPKATASAPVTNRERCTLRCT